MIEIKKGSLIKDLDGEEYKLDFDAKVKGIIYSAGNNFKFELAGKQYIANYRDIRFVAGDIENNIEIVIKEK